MSLAVARQQQERPREPLLARVEELIDEILFDADVPGEHVRDEPIRELRLLVQQRGPSLLSQCAGSCVAVTAVAVPMRIGWPARQPFPKKSPGPSIAITASRPVLDRTESLTLPSWM